MSWTFAGEPVDPLGSLRYGLEHEGRPIEKARVHRLVALAAVRLLRAAVELGLKDHELDWCTRAILAIDVSHEPPGVLDPEALPSLYPGGVFGLIATMNTLVHIHSGPPVVGEVVEFVRHGMFWATKRHRADRFCAHDSAELIVRAATLQGRLAERSGGDFESAVEAERREIRVHLRGPIPQLSS